MYEALILNHEYGIWIDDVIISALSGIVKIPFVKLYWYVLLFDPTTFVLLIIYEFDIINIY